MFSGIIEVTSPIRKVEELSHLVRIWVERPSFYTDIKIGDSIAVNGVCLTVEAFDSELIQFALAHETLKLLEIQSQDLPKQRVNLERSLRFGDRLHGHLVSGHVETLGKVLKVTSQGESLLLQISLPKSHRPHVWKKGSVAVHGVSLTVNEVGDEYFEVCLIPETLKQTNLAELKVGDQVHIETDYLAKAMFEKWKFWQRENTHDI